MSISSRDKKSETVAVIGAGLAGTISAIYLAKAGYRVILLEKEDRPMMVSSKIPVHLHSGGLYKGEVAEHCLHDSINFKQALPFAVTDRPTAFAVMKLDDSKKRQSGLTQLEEEALKLYQKDINKEISDIGKIPLDILDEYKDKAKANQLVKWQSMQEKFEGLKQKYKSLCAEYPEKKVFGEPEDFYKSYDAAAFKQYHQEAKELEQDPDGSNKDEWTRQLARISDPDQVVGVVMSSEVGLNMMRTGAGLEIELNKLKENQSLDVFTNVHVETVSRNSNGEIKLSVNKDGKIFPIIANQVVNAAGYKAKSIDMQMGENINWAVDVKGAGVIELQGKMFDHIPEVFFTEAVGMSHLSRFNSTMAGINYCDPEVEATYVKGGKIEYKTDQLLSDNPELARLEEDILGKSPTDPDLLERTKKDITYSSRFMPTLPDHTIPRAYVAGALGLIGNLTSRSSKEVYISDNGFHAINLAKGGGAVSTAMALTSKVQECSLKRKLIDQSELIFKNGSHSKLSEAFILSGESAKMTLDSRSDERARGMGLTDQLARKY